MEIMHCPSCNYKSDTHTVMTNREDYIMPKPGDISVCINCAQILQFTHDMKFKIANIGDFDNQTKHIVHKLKQLVKGKEH